MTAAKMDGLNHELKDHDGKTPGEYMESRIVMTDREVGIHEAWAEFAASLTSPQLKGRVEEPARVRGEGLNLEEQEQCESRWKVPGAFPITT